MSDKPREFWIGLKFSPDLFVEYKDQTDDQIHVIEYSAYEQAVKERDRALEELTDIDRRYDSLLGNNVNLAEENERLNKECNDYTDENNKLVLELVRIKAALEYALPILKALNEDEEIGDRAAYAGQAFVVVNATLNGLAR